tara:strand:+ start:1429 stop:2634 length:1206 start_codon:yes stop_codon:yes gene_type:complete
MNLNLSTNKSITTSRRKAAILLMYLDSKMPGLSQQLFAKMGESRSKMLLHEINQLGKVDKTEISHVMDEFYELAITQNSVIGGKNVTDKLLKDSFGIEDPDDFFSSKSGLFDFINHLSDKILIDYLKKENRQVAALVLSLIPDERSAKLLSEFPVEQTAIISKKMLTLDVPNYPLLWKFHRELELNLLGEDDDTIEESQQIFKLSRVLEMMVSDTRKTVVDMISTQDKSSADKIQELIFSFNDLVFMSNKDLGIMLVEIDPLSSLAVAMQGISAELKDKLLGSISERLKPRLEEEITNADGAAEEDVQKAQGSIVQLCRKLENEEKIDPLVEIIKQKQASNFVETPKSDAKESNEFPIEPESEEAPKPEKEINEQDIEKKKEKEKEKEAVNQDDAKEGDVS